MSIKRLTVPLAVVPTHKIVYPQAEWREISSKHSSQFLAWNDVMSRITVRHTVPIDVSTFTINSEGVLWTPYICLLAIAHGIIKFFDSNLWLHNTVSGSSTHCIWSTRYQSIREKDQQDARFLSLMWIRNQLDVMRYHLFLLYKLLNMFRATMCPSSGANDCVVLSPRVGIVPWLQEGCQNRLAGRVSTEEFVLRNPQWTHCCRKAVRTGSR